jgi:hypothetical protein
MKTEKTTAHTRNAFPTIQTDLLDNLTDKAERLLEKPPVETTPRTGFFRRLVA